MSEALKKRSPVGVHGGTHEQLVPFHDCDPLGIVWHGHYYKYLEIARTDLFHRHRLDVADFQALGYRLLMIETRCRYAFPLRFDERLAVEAQFREIEQRLLVTYEIRNLTHERRSARAWTTLVVTSGEGEMFMETPSEIRHRILDPSGAP